MAQNYRQQLVRYESSVAEQAAQFGILAFGAITGTTAVAPTTVLTANATRSGWIEVVSTLDADVYLTLGSVSGGIPGAEFALIKANASRIYDIGQALKEVRSGQVLGAYRRAGAPTVGELVVTLV